MRSLEIAAVACRCLPPGSADLSAAERELLLGTLRTWVDCGGSTSAAARELYCHRNTVRNRLQRVEELSGQSLRDPRVVAGLSIAAEGARLLGES
jgi:DNA-binding PucR family transcriptional regulator